MWCDEMNMQAIQILAQDECFCLKSTILIFIPTFGRERTGCVKGGRHMNETVILTQVIKNKTKLYSFILLFPV